MQQIDPNILRRDGDTQSRTLINDAVVCEYAAAYESGSPMPPVVAFWDSEHYWLADGFHRVLAAMKVHVETLPVDVREGSVRDAILFSCGANANHGVRRTTEDKRRAVIRLLNDDEWCQRSNRWIADRCHVSDHTVQAIRDEVYGPSQDSTAQMRSCEGEQDGQLRKCAVEEDGEEPDDEPTAQMRSCEGDGAPSGTGDQERRMGRDGKSRPAKKQKADDQPSESPAREYTDRDGCTYPPSAIPALQLAGEMRELCRMLDAAAHEAKRLQHTPVGTFLDGQGIYSRCEQAKKAVNAAMPAYVCPYCFGKPLKMPGCKPCREQGWVNATLKQNAPRHGGGE